MKLLTSFFEIPWLLTVLISYFAAKYNNALDMFPSNILAKLMRLNKLEVFQATDTERQNVSVAKLFNNDKAS